MNILRFRNFRVASVGKVVRRWAVDDAGATAIEYALIIAILSIVVASALPPVTAQLVQIFETVAAAFQAALA